ncbi:hypothetical protein [Flavobacterium sp. I3-2]|uniref:hypothetical protein n=1 Tax=Flavobacterium sp. I3-2 TaxID=2748319 RepID=UPI0015AEDD18|nr:hypothetical protein [Flavobacterium sp. I3-2]
MEKISKTISILIFTILLLVVGTVIWSFFDPYAQVLLLPLGFLSVYYLLLFSFVKLLSGKTSKPWKYLILFMIIVPLLSFAYGYNTFIRFSITVLNTFTE